MKFIAVAALFVGALAAPADMVIRNDPITPLCPNSLYANPICADVDVLGILCLNAQSPTPVPRDAKDFQNICASSGKEARCAVLPILGQAVLCIKPVGVQ